ncbi:hypothetical protein CTEN210_06636 [Chaetoceros tenuissimus]|uniref:Leucine-rich repeat domain-containing protein n=1 Tax=Chaetoceros tenuissimus TaxID=426638 RepID=A0AAD3CSQ9_9STRA|nr:hypothetical protein CTEN210_06636 [Chaetoceros tenuissimus]
MRVQNEEWRRFIPGSRMCQGKKTLFYNGEKLWEEVEDGGEIRYLIYDEEEQRSWEMIIVLPGVEEIPWQTFATLSKIETVIMSDSLKRIKNEAFVGCVNLSFVKLSRNLEFIGESAFEDCKYLSSIFIPPSCTKISDLAFLGCKKLIIMNVPQHSRLGWNTIEETSLFDDSPLEKSSRYDEDDIDKVNRWVKSFNKGREFSLHRLCCSTYEDEIFPIQEQIYEAVKEHGPKVLQKENKIGITPLKYLEENPYLENIDEMKMGKDGAGGRLKVS